LVRDKRSKAPFEAKYAINDRIFRRGNLPNLLLSLVLLTKRLGLQKPYNIHVYPGGGTVDGTNGDHIIIAPAYNITDEEVKLIVDRVGQLLNDFFDEFDASTGTTS
jgi:hypothetical protein